MKNANLPSGAWLLVSTAVGKQHAPSPSDLWERKEAVLLKACAGSASLVAQLVKNPPAMRETWVQSLGWEEPLEKKTAASILAWRIPGTV